jgi:methyl-accepting chemotaxis protein
LHIGLKANAEPMMQISIRHSFVGVLVAITLVAFATIGADFTTIRFLTAKFQGIATDEVAHLTNLKDISDGYAITIVDATHKAADGALKPVEAFQQVSTARRTIRETWQKFKAVESLSAAEREHVIHYDQAMSSAESFFARLETALQQGDLARIDAIRKESLYPTVDPLTEIIDKLVKLQLTSTASVLLDAENSGAFATKVQIAMGAFLLALVAGGLFLVRSRVIAPLTAMQSVMQSLAGGNHEVEVTGTERQDEIGGMARALEVFRENAAERQRLEQRAQLEREAEIRRQERTDDLIREFRASISGIRETLESQLEAMMSSSENLTNIAMSASEGAHSAQAASSEASTNVGDVASAASELTAASREISTQVHKASECVTRAMNVAREADEGISSLAELADRIGAIVHMINGIAEQTNMLALNATIEAARAGEAGRSFAVVASEVKTLAGQTAKATDEISQQVTSIQSATQGAVQLIRTISGTVSDIQGRTTAIAAAVEEQEASTHEISRSISLASGGSEQVASDVSSMAESVSRTSNEASLLRETTDKLAEIAGALSKSVDSFLEGVTRDVRDRRQAIRRQSRELVLINSGSRRVQSRCVDISEGGICVETDRSVAPSEVIEVEFLSGERIRSRVIWYRDGKAGLRLEQKIPQVLVDAMAA